MTNLAGEMCLVPEKDFQSFTGFTDSTMKRKRSDGSLPKHVTIGVKRYYHFSDVQGFALRSAVPSSNKTYRLGTLHVMMDYLPMALNCYATMVTRFYPMTAELPFAALYKGVCSVGLSRRPR